MQFFIFKQKRSQLVGKKMEQSVTDSNLKNILLKLQVICFPTDFNLISIDITFIFQVSQHPVY